MKVWLSTTIITCVSLLNLILIWIFSVNSWKVSFLMDIKSFLAKYYSKRLRSNKFIFVVHKSISLKLSIYIHLFQEFQCYSKSRRFMIHFNYCTSFWSSLDFGIIIENEGVVKYNNYNKNVSFKFNLDIDFFQVLIVEN